MNMESDFLELLQPEPTVQGETGAEAEIVLPDYCPNILRILQSSSEASVETVVPSGDKVTVEGSVEHTVLYLAEDGQEICAAHQQSRYRYSFDRRQETDGAVRISVHTRNTVARALSPQKLLIRTSVLLQMQTDGKQQVVLPQTEGDLERKLCRRPATVPVAFTRKPLRISDDFEAGDVPVKSVLFARVTCRETEQKPLEDKLIVKAEMMIDLFCSGENGAPLTLRRSIPVSQVADLPGTEEGDVFVTFWEPSLAVFTPREAEDGEEQRIAYDVQVDISVSAYRTQDVSWVEDVYSIKQQTECQRQTVTTLRLMPVQANGQLRESVEIGTVSDLIFADVCPQVHSVSYREQDACMVCEGVWNATFLVRDSDGTPISVQREIPFSIPCGSDPLSVVRNDTTVILTEVSVSLSDASHAEIRGNWDWSGAVFGEESCETVVKVDFIGPRPRSEDAMILYYAAKGESVWEIAKEHACPCDELKRANRLEEDEIGEDRMLTILCC